MRKVALVIPDAGPLISLAVGDHLELLLNLDLPIYVVDQVAWEVLGDRSREDARRVAAFVDDHPDVVTVFETFVGTAAAQARARDPQIRQRGLGEAAVAEFYSRLDEIIDPGEPVLLLFEDSDIRRINALVRGNVHLLSTRALLIGMERRGLISSADDVWGAIHAAGRRPSEAEIDQPAPAPFGRSRW